MKPIAKFKKSMEFQPLARVCDFSHEESILEVALKNNIEINYSCGGMGSCTTCRVIIDQGLELLPPRNELELAIAQERGFSDKERLSCQTPPMDGLVCRIP